MTTLHDIVTIKQPAHASKQTLKTVVSLQIFVRLANTMFLDHTVMFNYAT